MKLKIVLLTALFLGFSTVILSQNVLSIETKEVNTSTEFELAISLDNTDEIAAIQFDINYNANEFELLTGHSLTTRGINHSLGINSISEGVVRVLIYSSSNLNIVGNLGSLLALKLKSKNNPGDFPFTLSNVIFSSSSGSSIVPTIQNGVITVLGAKMQISRNEVNFGNVLLGSNPSNYITIQNLGNAPLEITGISEISPFSILESFPITIGANSSVSLTLQIDSASKFNGSRELSFINNDPDVNRNSQTVNLTAVVYAVNELRIGYGSGEMNTEVEIPVTIDNMENFTGFQFDILLPEGIEYVPNSIIESSRFDGHSIGVNLINGNTLRFIGYSPVNKNFIGNTGEVFSFKLKPIVNSGYFNLNVSNAILTNIAQENILSNSYSGSIQINTGELSINPSNILYGNVPITNSIETIARLQNYGNALLKVSEIVCSSTTIQWDALVPFEIEIGGFKDVKITFTPNVVGDFSETIYFNHNGSNNQSLITTHALVFSPNYLMVKNQNGYIDNTNIFEIELINNDVVKAVQFDILMPLGFALDVANVAPALRDVDYTVSASNLTGNLYRIVLYSLNNTPIEVGSGTIVKLPTFVDSTVTIGDYNLDITNVIISNMNNQDVSSDVLEIGKISIISQDDDGDGVMNNVDLCLSTPSGEAVNTNGCSASEINGDDDSDGVMNDIDTCPATPTGETVDVNGCSSSQLDDDGDGIMNNVDTCPATPAGEIVDTNGCSSSQLDDDGDGIMNDVDTCPATPTGETVDTNGCSIFTLPFNNFNIAVTSETCSGKNNGQLVITATENHNYVATINGTDYTFTNSKTITDLAPGSYSIKITITGETFEQWFSIEVVEGTTVFGKSAVKANKATVEIAQGTAPYQVYVNGKEVMQTSENVFSVAVQHGDLLVVRTAKTCEGVYSKSIAILDDFVVYPNPTRGIFEIAIPTTNKEVIIGLFTTTSQLVSRKTYPVNYGKVQLSLENQPAGSYHVKLHLEVPVTLTIIKE